MGANDLRCCHTLKPQIYIRAKECSYICNVCGMSLSSKSNLGKRERNDLKGKPYTCNFCSKSFVLVSLLAEHYRDIYKRETFQL